VKIEQIIFDFDGVILPSHKIKDVAFYELFLSYGKKIALTALNYHKKNIGKSRYIKFYFIIKYLLKEKVTKKKLDSLSKNFNQLTLKKINNLKISKYLLEFFKKEKKNYNFYISTGTPQNIIQQILKNKKISKYFKKVYGSPMNKIQHIKKIKKNKKKTLFIGDSMEDFICCKKTNTNFLLKEHNENKNIFLKKKILKIKNFKNFKNFLLYIN
jgi:phosphoglycolate phosphatase-like HAD superfamily hydrolase